MSKHLNLLAIIALIIALNLPSTAQKAGKSSKVESSTLAPEAHSAATVEKLKTSVVMLEKLLHQTELELNAYIYNQYIHDAEYMLEMTPTAALTLSIATRDSTIKRLREDFEREDSILLDIMMKDPDYNQLMAGNIQLIGNKTAADMKWDILSKLQWRSPEYPKQHSRRNETLRLSNITALKMYVEDMIRQGNFIHYSLIPANKLSNIKMMPQATRLETRIRAIKTILQEKEYALLLSL